MRRSVQRKKTLSFAEKWWSILTWKEFGVVRLLAEVDVVEVVDDVAPGEVRPHHVGAAAAACMVGEIRFWGMLLPGNGSRTRHAVHDPRGVRVVDRPRKPEKSPFSQLSFVGTMCRIWANSR